LKRLSPNAKTAGVTNRSQDSVAAKKAQKIDLPAWPSRAPMGAGTASCLFDFCAFLRPILPGPIYLRDYAASAK
jgi:hypothetical protein